jgi:hypothetical protein
VSKSQGSTDSMLQDLQAECRILTEDKYFTDPIAGEVYRVDLPGNPLVKVADSPQMSKKNSKGENHLER